MTLVAELLEKGKDYGREFVLLVIVLTAAGIGLKVVWESTNTRLSQQDTRIETSEKFIRDELIKLNMQTIEVAKSAVNAIDRNTEALDNFRVQP